MKNTLKKVTASVVTLMFALGLSLVAATPASAEGVTNGESYWQTPGTQEVCVKIDNPGGQTWTLPSGAPPAGTFLTKVIIKAGDSKPAENYFENTVYYQNAKYMITEPTVTAKWIEVQTWPGSFEPAGKYGISHVIYCYAPDPLKDVAGSASRTNEVCTENALVGGVITVVVTTGVVYEIKNSSNTVVPFDAGTGATSALPSGEYAVQVSAADGYNLTSAASIPLVISAYDGRCGHVEPTSVTPSASGTDQVCTEGSLVDGMIAVGIKPGVGYTVMDSNDMNIPFDSVTGKTGPLVEGTYIVHPTAESGYVLSESSDIDVTVKAAEGDCGQLVTHPLVTPVISSADRTCTANGSYTLGMVEGVIYTVNGTVQQPGTYQVSTAKTVDVVASLTSTDFGFEEGAVPVRNLTFTNPKDCGELTTLALPGSNGTLAFTGSNGTLAGGLLLGLMFVLFGAGVITVNRVNRRNS